MASIASYIYKANNIRIGMCGLMFFADVASCTLAVFFGQIINSERFNFGLLNLGEVEHTLPISLYLLMFMFSRLYPGIGINPAEEIKLVVQYCTIALLITVVAIFALHLPWEYAPSTLVLFWAFSIVVILLMRWSVRILAAQIGMWGEPVIIFARGVQIDSLANYFLKRRRLGFIPILAVTDSLSRKVFNCPVPVVNLRRLLAGDYPLDVDTILVDASFFGRTLRRNSYNKLTRVFKHVIFVSNMDWLEGASLEVRDFEGFVGIEASKGRIASTNSSIKRGMDILGSILGMLLFTPFLALVVVLIKLDSPGPVFYSQERISMDRRKKKRLGIAMRKILIYKFRSMYVNADQMLAEYLANNPQARLEWKRTQKLRDDPRITRVGRWLRKFSIDEIPQLYNILKGEMSLVGPRPMMINQVKAYGKSFEVYTGVRPGLTGFWQVSGRNTTTFKERARFDLYYVNNWSIWLDLYILARTIWVVLSREGAY